MTTSYSATYHTANGLTYPAVIFVSPVTITIRFRHNEMDQDIYWLTENLTAFTEQPAFTELQYPHPQGGADRLTVKDSAAAEALKTALRTHRLVAPAHRRVMGNIWVKLAVLAGIICVVLLMAYLWWVPAIGERAARSISKDSETSMGEKMYQSMKPSFTIDAQKTALLNQFYQQLHYNTGYPIEITVVTSDISNAFAIPGGHIVVYDAILDRMKTPEELAALLAHEASHIALRHSLRNIFRDLSRKMFLTLITGGQGDFVSVAINNANELKGLEYSRSLETDADNNGLRLMASSHIDVQGMERLMVMLQKEGGAEAPAAILSTHPVFKERILNIQEQIRKLPQEPTANAQALKDIFRALY